MNLFHGSVPVGVCASRSTRKNRKLGRRAVERRKKSFQIFIRKQKKAESQASFCWHHTKKMRQISHLLLKANERGGRKTKAMKSFGKKLSDQSSQPFSSRFQTRAERDEESVERVKEGTKEAKRRQNSSTKCHTCIKTRALREIYCSLQLLPPRPRP